MILVVFSELHVHVLDNLFELSSGLAMVARFLFKFLASVVSIFVITIIAAIAALIEVGLANS